MSLEHLVGIALSPFLSVIIIVLKMLTWEEEAREERRLFL